MKNGGLCRGLVLVHLDWIIYKQQKLVASGRGGCAALGKTPVDWVSEMVPVSPCAERGRSTPVMPPEAILGK